MIIVGIRADLDLKFKVPSPTGERVTAGEALSNIPVWAKNQQRTKQSSKVVERLNFIDPGENVWNAKRLPDNLKLNVPKTQLSQIYKSSTLTNLLTRLLVVEGGTHMYHWAENRALTNRERARLQTFPDNFEFYGSKESVRKQIGMASPSKAHRL